jgi:predicted transcriptional regulator
MPNRTATNLKLDAATQARLRRLADQRHRSAERLIREAIEEYLERHEGRDRLREAAFAAWAEYQETGLHVAEAEADAWLARLESGEDAEPPEPHR